MSAPPEAAPADDWLEAGLRAVNSSDRSRAKRRRKKRKKKKPTNQNTTTAEETNHLAFEDLETDDCAMCFEPLLDAGPLMLKT